MIEPEDLYAVLQVHPEAEPEVIDAAYRRLAAKYHPDRNKSQSAEQRMKEINAAYEVLSDANKRQAYDATRNRARTGSAGRRDPRPAPPVFSLSRLFIPLGILIMLYLSPRLGPSGTLMLLIALVIIYLLLSGSKNETK